MLILRSMKLKFNSKILFPACLILLLIPTVLKSQSIESYVKASLLFKIAQYTEWNTANDPKIFQIAVLGKTPFTGELEKIAAKTRIKNKPVVINYINDYKKAEGAEIIFICSSEKKAFPEIIRAYQEKNTLLISDSPNFSGNGVHFNFIVESDETIHFEIDLQALKKAGLKPDLQLLSIGKIIN